MNFTVEEDLAQEKTLFMDWCWIARGGFEVRNSDEALHPFSDFMSILETT
jgi:hypothetical protein